MQSISVSLIGITLPSLLASGLAQAHHPANPQSVGIERPDLQVAIETEGTDLQLGMLWSLGLSTQYSVYKNLWLALEVPVHHLSVDGGSAHKGLGDMRVASRLRVIDDRREGFTLELALAVEVPTGDHHTGLGSGHLELAPSIWAAKIVGPVKFHGAFGGSRSLDTDHGHETVSPMVVADPHSSQELTYQGGLTGQASERVLLTGLVRGSTDLAAGKRGETYLSLAPRASLLVGAGWRIAVRAEIPVTPRKRLDWSVASGLSLAL